MADSTCGPSNAFKGLATHVDRDRSLHRDRVAGGPHQHSQNFRSAAVNPELAGEYGAFHQQFAELPQHPTTGIEPQAQGVDHLQLVARRPAGSASNAGSSWVGDFENMSLAAPGAVPGQRQQQLQHMSPYMPQHMNQHMNQPYTGFGPRQMRYCPQQPFPPAPGAVYNPEPSFASHRTYSTVQEALDAKTQEALDREFERAMDEWMAQNGPQAEAGQQHTLGTLGTGTFPPPNFEFGLHHATDEESPEEEEEEENEEKSPTSSDGDTELARAAQELVDSVADNESDKFRNSQFLHFMRRLASQELTVRNNELVDSQAASGSSRQIENSASSSAQQSNEQSGFGQRETHA
ncbi:hypothetical protein F5Y17DRAFT_452302 [Xylariaceae sp. FL0594]|nr:hypothetical protein F5Y17DRAFT_452302 [Xylariaceae sp. FL0594]